MLVEGRKGVRRGKVRRIGEECKEKRGKDRKGEDGRRKGESRGRERRIGEGTGEERRG